jgi:Domain of unknown function (DUF4142)
VEETKLGIARGTAPEVKQHGEMLAKDHSGFIAAFERIFMKHGIKRTAPSDNAATGQRHQAVIDSLRTRSGANFDREYITEAIIDLSGVHCTGERDASSHREGACARSSPEGGAAGFQEAPRDDYRGLQKTQYPRRKMIMEDVRVFDRSLSAASNLFDGTAELVSVHNRDGPRRKSNRTASCYVAENP